MGSYTRLHRGSLDTINGKLLPIDKTGLVAYYPFWQNTGTTLYDESKNGNDGTITGPVWNWGTAQSKPYMTGDGTDDYIDIGNQLISGEAAFTIIFWARCSTGINDPCIYGETNDGSTPHVVIYYGDTTISATPSVRWRYEDGTNNIAQIDGTTDVSDGAWHMVSAVRRGAGDHELFLDDAVSEGTTTVSASTFSTTLQMLFGITGYGQYYHADAHWFLVLNTALTTAEISTIYNKTKP